MLLALNPALLHALQDLFETLLIDVRCGVQAPLEVLPLGEPRLEQISAHGLGVPAPPDEGQAVQHALAVVAGQIDPHDIRQLALLRRDDAVQGTKDGQGEARAAAHVDALAGSQVIPLLQLKDQRRQPRRGHVVLVHKPTKATLEGCAVVPLQAGLGSMTLQAQGPDAVRRRTRAMGAPDSLHMPCCRALALQQVQEDLQAGPGQAVPAIGPAPSTAAAPRRPRRAPASRSPLRRAPAAAARTTRTWRPWGGGPQPAAPLKVFRVEKT